MAEQGKPPTDKAATPKKQQLSIAEYKALQEKETKKFKLKIPTIIKIILAIPFVIIFLFGLFYIPYLLIKSFSR